MSETIDISKNDAIKAFRDGTESDKSLLRRLFSTHKDIFNQKITDRVKSFEDACEIKGVLTSEILPFHCPKNSFQEALNAMSKMAVIIEVLNEGWTPNWNDSNQRKWYPLFDMRAGFRFVGSACDWTDASSHLGSRFCLKSEELANYAGKQFGSIYKQFLTLPNHEQN